MTKFDELVAQLQKSFPAARVGFVMLPNTEEPKSIPPEENWALLLEQQTIVRRRLAGTEAAFMAQTHTALSRPEDFLLLVEKLKADAGMALIRGAPWFMDLAIAVRELDLAVRCMDPDGTTEMFQKAAMVATEELIRCIRIRDGV